MRKKKTIGIDLDTTLNNLLDVWLTRYNIDYKDNLTVEDILTWDIVKYVKPECWRRIFDYPAEDGFFRRLDIQPNARDVIKTLQQFYDIYIVTAYNYKICKDKVEWVMEHLPSINIENIIFCNDKSKIDLDYLIDDRDINITGFKGHGVVFDMPYNRHLGNDYTRVHNWTDVAQLFSSENKNINSKKIIILNGSGRSGKGEFAKCLNRFVPTKSISSVDMVKEKAKELFGWNGEKDEQSRKMLSDLKNLMSAYNDSPFKYMSEQILSFFDTSDMNMILTIDIREPEEIQRMVDTFSNIHTVLIKRSDAPKIKLNTSDTNVDNYNYDFIIHNDFTLKKLEQEAKILIHELFDIGV